MALLGPVLSTLYIVKIVYTSSILCTVYQIWTSDGSSLTNSSAKVLLYGSHYSSWVTIQSLISL